MMFSFIGCFVVLLLSVSRFTSFLQTKVYKILKQISKDVKETKRIQGNIDENVFLRYCEMLWNTTNINELQLEYNSTDYLHAFIALDELEKVLKLTKNCKTPGQDNINSTAIQVRTRRV